MANLQIRVGIDKTRGYVAHCKLLREVVSAHSINALRWRCVNLLNGRKIDFVMSMEARLQHQRQQALITARRPSRVQPSRPVTLSTGTEVV
jgi:hypothetical protein